jgi:hypothetical protein
MSGKLKTIARMAFPPAMLMAAAGLMWAQQISSLPAPLPDAPSATPARMQVEVQQSDSAPQNQGPDTNPGPSSTPGQSPPDAEPQKKQPKRILYVIPNYRAVSADANLPPLTPKGKLKLMVDDSFDYSAFLYTGFVAGLRYGIDSYPELGRGWSGYGRYYWRFFVDQADGNAFTEFLLPVVFKQDPRYFTKGHGSFWNRAGYAASRLVVTRSDKQTEQFNISEIAGNLAAAGISTTYYPPPERGVSNVINSWVVQLALDGGFDVIKEFWPDIAHKVFHQKD